MKAMPPDPINAVSALRCCRKSPSRRHHPVGDSFVTTFRLALFWQDVISVARIKWIQLQVLYFSMTSAHLLTPSTAIKHAEVAT